MKKTGFTLIELLVVVAIIGILASVVLASLNSARERGRDARRLSDLKQIQAALEMYYNDFGYYPKRDNAYTSASGGTASWTSLVADLSPYLSSVPGDPLGLQDTFRYRYDSDIGDNNQTYGMMISFESGSNFNKTSSDGGYYQYATNGNYYEVGQQPAYCAGKYTLTNSNWWSGAGGTMVCTGGN